MKSTFYIKSPRLISICVAIFMSFFVFCILPMSFNFKEKTLSENETLIRVYSSINKRQDVDRKEINYNDTSLQPLQNNVSQSQKVATLDLDFNSVSTDIPNLSTGEALDFSTFTGGTLTTEDSQIMLFDLASLDNIPKRLNNINIDYPRDMLRRGIEGKVLLNVILDEDGCLSVESVVSSTNKSFESPAIAGAEKLIYQPPTRNGKIVKAKFILPIPFTLK